MLASIHLVSVVCQITVYLLTASEKRPRLFTPEKAVKLVSESVKLTSLQWQQYRDELLNP